MRTESNEEQIRFSPTSTPRWRCAATPFVAQISLICRCALSTEGVLRGRSDAHRAHKPDECVRATCVLVPLAVGYPSPPALLFRGLPSGHNVGKCVTARRRWMEGGNDSRPRCVRWLTRPGELVRCMVKEAVGERSGARSWGLSSWESGLVGRPTRRYKKRRPPWGLQTKTCLMRAEAGTEQSLATRLGAPIRNAFRLRPESWPSKWRAEMARNGKHNRRR